MNKSSKIFILIALLTILFFTLEVSLEDALRSLNFEAREVETVSWDLLERYDYISKTIPEDLKKLDSKVVKIPGYIVSLSDNYSVLNKFLLVPDPQSCVHGPPPPPNLIVMVTLKRPIPARKAPYVAWITGVFKVEQSNSRFGGAAYKMTAERIDPFEQ